LIGPLRRLTRPSSKVWPAKDGTAIGEGWYHRDRLYQM